MVVVIVVRGRVTGKSEISNVNLNIPTVYKIAVRHKTQVEAGLHVTTSMQNALLWHRTST